MIVEGVPDDLQEAMDLTVDWAQRLSNLTGCPVLITILPPADRKPWEEAPGEVRVYPPTRQAALGDPLW